MTGQHERVQIIEPSVHEADQGGVAVECRGVPPQELVKIGKREGREIIQADRYRRVAYQHGRPLAEMAPEKEEVDQIKAQNLTEQPDVPAH
jgi:hypothetical protein